MASLMYNTLFETPYNDELMRRVRENALRKEQYNPTEPYHISYMNYPSVNGSGRSRVLMCGGARNGDPRSLGLDHDPRYLRSGSTINFPNYQFSAMMANPASGGMRSNDGFHYQDDFNPYYNRVVSANFGTNRPTFSRGGSKVGDFFKKVGNFLKPVGREVLPVLKDVGKELLVEGIKGAVMGAGVRRRGRPRKVVGVGQFEGSGHPVGSAIPNDMYMGSGKFENKILRVVQRKMTGGVALYKPNGKIFKGLTHVMPDGVIHSGKNHTKSSVPLTEMTAGNARTFFRKVGNTFKTIGKAVAPVAVPILKEVGKDLLKGAILGAGKFENKILRVVQRKMTGGVALYKPNGKIFKGLTHVMPDGVIHSGKNHTKSSVPLTEMTAGNARTFFRKVGNTFKTIGRAVAPVAVPILKEVGKDLLKGAILGAGVGACRGGKRSNVNKEGDPKMCAFLAKECGATPTRAGRPKGAKNKKSGGSGMSVDSAGILSVTPNPPPALQVVGGSNIGRKIKNTFKKVGQFLAPAVPVLKDIGREVYKEVKPILVEEGKKQLKEGIKGAISGSGTKKGQVRKTARKAFEGKADKKVNARAEIVKKVMKERGVKLIEASKIVKAEGLYKK